MPNAWYFPPFSLDIDAGQLLRGEEVVALRPKAWAVLFYLVEHAGHLVTKDMLFSAVWPRTVVSDATLTVTIAELRAALGDDRHAPRYIQTVRGRGVRFNAPVQMVSTERPQVSLRTPPTTAAPSLLVGRERELEWLTERFELARCGRRQVVFVSGEAGIGKTALVDTFVDSAVSHAGGALRAGHGQCVEAHGETEPYMPVFEALAELGRGPDGTEVIALLRHYAPVVLSQMPGFLSATEGEALCRSMEGSAAARMLRFIADGIDALARDRFVLLVIEDLHWSDPSTVDLLAVIAQRRAAARLMLIVTHRPIEAVATTHPIDAVRAELVRKQLAGELPLTLLSAGAVHEYVRWRLSPADAPTGAPAWLIGADDADALAQVIHARTDGHPFFVVAAVDHALARGPLAYDGRAVDGVRGDLGAWIPEEVGSLVQRQLAMLDRADCRVLEVASVVGAEFSAGEVAAVLVTDGIAVDGICHRLAHAAHFIRSASTRPVPPGAPAGRYSFRHELVRQVLYDSLPEADRAGIHQRIGTYLAAAHHHDIRACAATIAEHFERGGDAQRTVTYLQHAAEFARQRCAYVEASRILQRALETLEGSGPAVDIALRWQLQHSLGEAYWRVGDSGRAHECFEAALATARRCDDPRLLAQTVLTYGRTLGARDLDHSDTLVRLTREAVAAVREDHPELRPALLSRLAFALYFRPEGWACVEGRREREASTDAALQLAQELAHPGTLAVVLYNCHWSRWGPDNLDERRRMVAQLAQLTQAHGNLDLLLEAQVLRFSNALEAGERADADDAVTMVQRLSEDLQQPWYRYVALLLLGIQSQLAGHVADAHQLSARAHEIGATIDAPLARQVFEAQQLVLAATQGYPMGSLASVRSLIEEFPNYPFYRAVLAGILADLGCLDAAHHEVDQLSADDFADVPRNNLWLSTLTTAVGAVVRLRDVRRAEILYARLLPYVGRGVTLHQGLGYQGCVGRYLGILAAALGKWSAAEESFETAIAHDTALGATPWVVQARAAYATALRTRRRRGDLPRANALLHQAAEEAAAVALNELANQCRADPTPLTEEGSSARLPGSHTPQRA